MLYSCLCTSFVSCYCVLSEKIDENGSVVTIDHFSRLRVGSLLVSYGDSNVWPDGLVQATVAVAQWTTWHHNTWSRLTWLVHVMACHLFRSRLLVSCWSPLAWLVRLMLALAHMTALEITLSCQIFTGLSGLLMIHVHVYLVYNTEAFFLQDWSLANGPSYFIIAKNSTPYTDRVRSGRLQSRTECQTH